MSVLAVSEPALMNFEFSTPKIIFGQGAVKNVGKLAAELGGTRVFVITGKDQTRAAPVVDALSGAGLQHDSFPVPGEPTTQLVMDAIGAAMKSGCDMVISIGGGSVIDTGKAVAALLGNGGEPLDYLEVIGKGQKLTKASAPFIAVPTTAGTGAEVTQNAVLDSPEHKQKCSMRSPFMVPNIALVDPELTLGVPPAVTAATGLDAFTQCIEPFISNKSNPITDALSIEAMRRASRSLRAAFEDGSNLKAREDMCMASLLAGLALANSKLGAVHGFAGPLGGMFPAPHGAVCGCLLPICLEVNLAALRQREPESPALARFTTLGQILTGRPEATAEDAVAFVQELCRALAVPKLSAYGVTEDHVVAVVAKAAGASSMAGNPIKLTEAELSDILRRAI